MVTTETVEIPDLDNEPSESIVDAVPELAVAAELVTSRPAMRILGSVLAVISILCLSLLAQLAVIGALAHDRDQDKAFRELRDNLAKGIAPVGPVDDSGNLLEPGTPMAILEIPALGVTEVILEGTTSTVLMSGPGHRRDTPLPGQSGTSVVFGRRGAYGAPFERVRELRPRDELVVTTGQGRHTFSVLSVRRAGDPLPPALKQGSGRLTLVTADGPAFKPTGVLRVDADLTSGAQPTPAQIPARALPSNEANLAGDLSALLPLMLWGMWLVAAAVGTVWVRHRVGRWQAWVIGVPVLVALGGAAADSVAALLPNLL